MVRQLKSLYDCISPEAFDSGWSSEYVSRRGRLWEELYLLNINVYIIAETQNSMASFGKILFRNSYNTAVLGINKLAIDDQYSITLNRFKREIRQNLRFSEHIKELDSKLKEIDFNKKFKIIKSVYYLERNLSIAHSPEQITEHGIITQAELSRQKEALENLENARNLIIQLYDALRLKGTSAAGLPDKVNKGEIASTLNNLKNEGVI